ncbi:MAG TPA: hypothetical protein VGK74_17210 [Symbiobacteriaceae bacterium]|jgi:hypothetical protein
MSRDLYSSVFTDLEVWEPEIPPERRDVLAERIAHQLTTSAAWAEYRPAIGGVLFWHYDARCRELLATYPSGANRIRTI